MSVAFSPPTSPQEKIIARASTFQFIPKNQALPSSENEQEHSIPSGTHWVDHAQPGTIAIIEQPAGQYCAAVGGIMATRMKVLGVQAVLVDGRVRDLGEIRGLQLPVGAFQFNDEMHPLMVSY